MLKNLLILFLVVNAIFWGLFPHKSHCKLASNFTSKCPPHYVHLLIGIISFIIAVYVAQKDYIDSFY